MYIYKTTNLINGKIYVGKSEKLIEETQNYYGSGIKLKKAISKYGVENFKKEIIDNAETISELNQKEKYWIKSLNSQERPIGYNIADGGDGGNTGGMSPEVKAKKSEVGEDGLNEFQRQVKKAWENRSEESIKNAVEKANNSKQRILENGLTVAQNAARKAQENRDLDAHIKQVKETWENKSEEEIKVWGEKTSIHMKKYFKEYPNVMELKINQMKQKTKDTVSAYNIVTKEYKRVSIEEFESNHIWVGQKWKGFYEIRLPGREPLILTRVLEIDKLSKELGVDKDWIMRRKNSHLPFKHRVKRHKHLDGTVINFHSPDRVKDFF